MASSESIGRKPVAKNGRDVGFAIGIIIILAVLFLPIPAFLIDIGLAFSIALSVLILMVALWIQRPLDFSSFPTILLIATMLRLSLNIATTRMILSHGGEGTQAAGYVMQTTQVRTDGLVEIEASPEAGLTNAQLWAKYGIAFAGSVAPPTAVGVDPNLSNGLLAPI